MADLSQEKYHPVLEINVSRLAEELDLSRKTIQRFLDLCQTPGKVKSTRGKPFFKKIETKGNQANKYRIRWDFRTKERQCDKKKNQKKAKKERMNCTDNPSNKRLQYLKNQPGWKRFAMDIAREKIKKAGLSLSWLNFFGKVIFKIELEFKKIREILQNFSQINYEIELSSVEGYCWINFTIAFRKINEILSSLSGQKNEEQYTKKLYEDKGGSCPESLRKQLKNAGII